MRSGVWSVRSKAKRFNFPFQNNMQSAPGGSLSLPSWPSEVSSTQRQQVTPGHSGNTTSTGVSAPLSPTNSALPPSDAGANTYFDMVRAHGGVGFDADATTPGTQPNMPATTVAMLAADRAANFNALVQNLFTCFDHFFFVNRISIVE